jgi:hypothetical protein
MGLYALTLSKGEDSIAGLKSRMLEGRIEDTKSIRVRAMSSNMPALRHVRKCCGRYVLRLIINESAGLIMTDR